MSAHFAIPATTFVLQRLIERALAKVYGPGMTAPPVSVAPPPRSDPLRPPTGGDPEATSVLLFLYHVAPNPGWRNIHDAPVDSGGTRVARAPLVLDLHYLVAATGTDLEREAVFGVALHALTRLGIVPRDTIKAILSNILLPAAPTKLLDLLPGEQLWKQYEQITLSQQMLDADTLSRLWTGFQSPFRPSAGITATTVMLDIDETFVAGPDVDKVTVSARPDPAIRADPDGEMVVITDKVALP